MHDTALIDWGSVRLKRVVKSTLAAEAAAMSHSYDKAVYLRSLLSQVLYGRDGTWEKRIHTVPQSTSSDCRSLYDMLDKDTSMP